MSEARPRNLFTLLCLVLTLGTAALYWPITSHPFILYDDEEYITANSHVTTGLSGENFRWAFDGAHAANWHPLTWISHQADCSLFGVDAGGHHLMNLLFHVANTLLLFVFLRGATGAVWRSAIVAALFAWHPLHVESVAWASERKDVLSTFFWLLTLMAYVRYAQSRTGGGWQVTGDMTAASHVTRHALLYYFAALIFFALGLMSKPMVVTLPFVLLLLDWWPLNRVAGGGWQVRNCKRLLLEKLPFFALAAAGSAVTYLVQSGAGAVWQTPLINRLANAVIAYARYVAKTFWPSDLAIVYSHPNHWPVALSLGALAVLVVWTVLSVRLWRTRPFLAGGWFWFLGTLVPTIGIVQVGAQSMADRYTYIPSIGFFIALVWGAAAWLATRTHGKIIFLAVMGVALIGCAWRTSVQIADWRNSTALFLRAIEVSPDNYVAANCLGKAFEKSGDKARALVLYRNAVELAPRYPQGQFNYAMSLLEFGELEEGLVHLQAAAALEPRNPDIQYDLGLFFAQHGSWTNALACFSNSVALRPASAYAQFNLGSAIFNLGHGAEAMPYFREALRLQPVFPEAEKQLKQIFEAHPELR